MKRVLIQDNHESSAYLETLRDLLESRINDDGVELEFAYCLDEPEFRNKIDSYDLIVSHPHVLDDCCVPLIKIALQKGVQVVLFYKASFPHGKGIEALAKTFNLGMVHRRGQFYESYFEAIERYLLRK